MRRMRCVLAALLLLLSACAPADSADGSRSWDVYFTSGTVDAAALTSEARTLPPGLSPTDGLLRALLDRPLSEALTSPIPKGVRLLSWHLDEVGTLVVDLSEQYGGLAGVDLTLADYAITLTLSALPGVEAVSILVEGSPIPFRDHQLLRKDDILLSGSEGLPISLTVPLYYLGPDGGLVSEEREVRITERDNLPTALLTALMAGPADGAHSFPLPAGTELISASVDGDVCYVNFSAPFAQDAPSSATEAKRLLYAIVNTLCAQENISAVHLMVDGKRVERYGGIPTNAPLEPDFTLAGQ